MLLLRNKEQRSNNPLTSFATGICKRSRKHEQTVSSPWHQNSEPTSCAGQWCHVIF